ncbi:MAG: hypothetical protein QXI19_07540 [Candidatus Caldarchaeum sp.]
MGFAQRRVEKVVAVIMKIPPIVGVPSLDLWEGGPSSLIFSLSCNFERYLMVIDPNAKLRIKAVRPAPNERKVMYLNMFNKPKSSFKY